MMVTNRIEQNRVNVTSFDDPQHQETTRKREKKHCFHTGRKNGFTERQRWSQTRDKGHLCTSLTRDKCLPLPAVKGESSGDKGRFCHAFNPYLWRASKVYFISICTPIKGVVKYVWDSGQRCDKSAVKLCLWLKSKACEKCRQMCLSLRSNVWQSCRQMRLKFKSKV